MQKAVIKDFSRYISLNILGMLGLSFYILADTYFISKALGAVGIASLNLSIPIYSFIHGVGLMVGMGAATRFSILKSQHKKDSINKINIVFSNAMKIGLLMGILFLLIGLFGAKHLANVLGADSLTLAFTQTYLRIILSFSPFFIINNILLAYVRNDNHPKLAMRAMLIGSFSNIILDYIFIFPFNMGMLGAALATALAPIISVLVLLSHFIYRKNTFKYISSKLSINIVRDIFSLGLSSFIIEISSAVVLITLNIVILRIEGNIGLAAYGIVANLALVVIAIFTGLAQGTQPLISKYFGQGNRQMVRAVRKYALVTALFIAATIYFFTYVYSNTIIQIFNSENNLAVSAIASIGLKIYFLGFFFSGLNIVATMVLSATASIKHALFLSISRGFLIMIPTIFIFSYFWDMKGVWWAFVITELLTTLLAIHLEKTKIIKEQ